MSLGSKNKPCLGNLVNLLKQKCAPPRLGARLGDLYLLKPRADLASSTTPTPPVQDRANTASSTTPTPVQDRGRKIQRQKAVYQQDKNVRVIGSYLADEGKKVY